MHRVCMALALVAVLPLSARAEPVTVDLYSSSQASVTGASSLDWFFIDLGAIQFSGENSSATFYVDGLHHGSDYNAAITVSNAAGLSNLRLEVLDPRDGDDAFDPATQPEYVPAGYSTSNKFDGFSFAQDSGLRRAATFAGGSANAVADETTHRGDILIFSGLNGAEEARITFGLRDRLGERGFLVRISGLGGNGPENAAHSPEPASMLLLATGIAVVAGGYRRRLHDRRG